MGFPKSFKIRFPQLELELVFRSQIGLGFTPSSLYIHDIIILYNLIDDKISHGIIQMVW